MPNTPQAADRRGYRITAIDALRGAIVVVMALDHVRDFTMLGAAQDPTADPHVSAALFFTRWITHYCAPIFCCLAGVSAGLMRHRKSAPALARFLASRGLWLLLVEVLIISTAITMAPFGGEKLIILQTLTAIGGSMILLAGAQFLGQRAVLAAGIAICLLHNTLDGHWPDGMHYAGQAPLWVGLHSQMIYPVGGLGFLVGYPLLPWFGVMFLGFGTAPLFELPADRRARALRLAGGALIGAFLLLRALDIYGDPRHWHVPAEDGVRVVLNFLNTTKYPPSLQYLCMTLGPGALFCAAAESWRGRIKDALVMFGRVPFAFYVAHFWLARVISLLVGLAQGRSALVPDPGFGVTLPWIYVIWVGVVVSLYPLCAWVASVKTRRTDWWLSYL